MLVEVVCSIKEFISKVDPHQDVHYEIESNIVGFGDMAYVKLTLYGIGRSTPLIKCVLVESVKWNDDEVRKHKTGNVFSDLKLWIKEKEEEMKKMAMELQATPGKYEILALRGSIE